MQIHATPFGVVADSPVASGPDVGDAAEAAGVTLLEVDTGGLRASVCDYGARLVSLTVPDRDGELADVVLGFDDVAGYVEDRAFVGATCGRYGNRIRRGRFSIDGVSHEVDVNEPPNHLHGGQRGFDRAVWSIDIEEGAVVFSLDSADGEQGFPGALHATTTYRFAPDQVRIEMRAVTDESTIVNLVHHTYWNLAGHDQGSALGHELMIEAEAYTPVDDENLPTGELAPVVGTGFDFRQHRLVGGEAGSGDGVAYDHNWVLRKADGRLRRAALLRDPRSGRALRLDTTAPGLQFYAGGGLGGGPVGKGGAVYGPNAGLALESQVWPDSPNHAHFPDPTLHPRSTYAHDMLLTFSGRDNE
ncbi:MAG: galactose mutarotase [Actinomycetia bacterium]|nr:galactose mutarotase [Actinomycetes bacterium]